MVKFFIFLKNLYKFTNTYINFGVKNILIKIIILLSNFICLKKFHYIDIFY